MMTMFPARTTLTTRDRVVLRAVAEAMFSEDGEVEEERLDAHLDELDAYMSPASKELRAGLRFALFVLRITPLLLFFRPCMIESLSVADRVRVLTRLERSALAHLSLVFVGWRTVMTFVFYEQPAELAAIGYVTERNVYKRRLALVPQVAPQVAPAPAPALAPVAQESGVRLRDVDLDSEHGPAVAANDTEKVA